MRLFAAILLLLSLAVVHARGADDPRRAQVAAATADALGALRDDVMAAPVTADVTVEEFVEKTGSRDELTRALRRAEQIGGTRWLDDQTCQVRMELRGSELADTLVQIAAANPREAGLPPDVLRERVAGLRERMFAATGVSTSDIDRLRPPPEQDAWRGVPNDAIRAAVGNARRSAARQIVDSVQDVPLPGAAGEAGGATLATMLGEQKVRDSLEGWAMNRPVTSVNFGDDLEVRVAVAVTGEDLWDELVAAMAERKDLPFPQDEQSLRELREQVLRRVEPAVGRARAQEGGGGAADQPGRATVDVPRDPPQWVSRHVVATGTAAPGDGRLKTARAAENAGREQLRRRVEELSLSRQLTLGEAARRDHRIRDAIERTVRRAKVRKVNYLADRSAEVSFALDLRELWYELESPR